MEHVGKRYSFLSSFSGQFSELRSWVLNCLYAPPDIIATSFFSRSFERSEDISLSIGDLLLASVPSRSKIISFLSSNCYCFYFGVIKFYGGLSYQNFLNNRFIICDYGK